MTPIRNASFRFTIVAALACFATLALAQTANQPLTVKKIKDNIYVAEGDGGSSGIIIGQNGVMVVDAKTTADGGKQIVDDVRTLTNEPITTVILTHSDADHVSGLVSFQGRDDHRAPKRQEGDGAGAGRRRTQRAAERRYAAEIAVRGASYPASCYAGRRCLRLAARAGRCDSIIDRRVFTA